MIHRALIASLGASAYGFAIGSVHSTKFAMRNLVKMPLLLGVTAGVCSLAYYVCARAMTRNLDFRAVQREAFSVFADSAILLGSLAPPMFFLAHAIERPDERGLHEYELFLVTNVVVIAASGALALARRVTALEAATGLGRARSSVLLGAWMALSLLVGSQWSWYLRPFCGVATVDAPFILGTEPDFRGDRSFFEAFIHALERHSRGDAVSP
jgi:hypothetical protein